MDISPNHRAECEKAEDGTWRGGCRTCGTGFYGATEIGADSWCSGHNSAIDCLRFAVEDAARAASGVRDE